MNTVRARPPAVCIPRFGRFLPFDTIHGTEVDSGLTRRDSLPPPRFTQIHGQIDRPHELGRIFYMPQSTPCRRKPRACGQNGSKVSPPMSPPRPRRLHRRGLILYERPCKDIREGRRYPEPDQHLSRLSMPDRRSDRVGGHRSGRGCRVGGQLCTAKASRLDVRTGALDKYR